MNELAPFILKPVLVERPWGGRRLAGYGKELQDGVHIGESWEIADLPAHVVPTVADPCSRVVGGTYEGAALHDIIAEAGEALLGPIAPTPDGRFPMLFKLLDARENLSVQVHPDEDYVADHPEARLKTESWYVIEADDGAVLYLDLVDGTDHKAVADAFGSNSIVPTLRTVSAKPTAFHHVPAGLVHALGAGILVAEVQTPSDTTFRLYDWAVEYERSPRQLHLEEGIASIRIHPDRAFSLPPSVESGLRHLVTNEHYWMSEHRCRGGTSGLVGKYGPKIVNVVSGAVAVGGLEIQQGTTAVIPAASSVDTIETDGPAVVLEIGFP